MENIDNLSEKELLELEKRWKNNTFPRSRLYALIGWNVVACAGAMYYTINFKHYSKRFFKPKTYGLGEIVKYGKKMIILT